MAVNRLVSEKFVPFIYFSALLVSFGPISQQWALVLTMGFRENNSLNFSGSTWYISTKIGQNGLIVPVNNLHYHRG